MEEKLPKVNLVPFNSFDGTNFYRTKRYIVKQDLSFYYDGSCFNILISEDTFYLRNENIDREYDEVFKINANPEGKRIVTSMSTRRYVG